jgi:hypothetical protein
MTKRKITLDPDTKMQPEQVLPSVKQRILIAWISYASAQALVPSQKKYKEAQLAFVANLAEKMGGQFPQEILECAIAKRDIATLLRGGNDDKSKSAKQV